MNRKLKTIAVGSLVASSLMLAAVPVIARDRTWFDRHHRWDHVRDWRWDHAREWHGREFNRQYGSQYNSDQLQQAEQQAQYDASHHASRKKIARDQSVIDSILNGMGYQR